MTFNQNSVVADLSKVRDDAEIIIRRHAHLRKLTLLLPATLDDALGEVMRKKIIPVIARADYLSQIILGLDGCHRKKDFLEVKKLFKKIPHAVVLWNDSPEMKVLLEKLRKRKFNVLPGKGRNVWLMLNYWYATTQSTNVIMHDCDIVTYSERFLHSLALPLVDPKLDYDFVKLYYERITSAEDGEKLAGRVVRLMLTPLLEALRIVFGYDLRVVRQYLEYLGMYKYAFSGEFGLSRKLASRLPLAADWALETDTLSFLFQSPFKICQVDVGRYDHKHSPLSPHDKNKGLHKMSLDISKAIFRKLYDFGALGIMNRERFDMLLDYYRSEAERLIITYRDRSAATNLMYNSSEEELAVETFAHAIAEAYDLFHDRPTAIKPLPSVHRMDSRVQQQLVAIAYKYNKKLY